jgi:hypothetical protein
MFIMQLIVLKRYRKRTPASFGSEWTFHEDRAAAT